ncbi:MAG: hypothetical protein R2733_12360 [Acidimicrobiales bacterium]
MSDHARSRIDELAADNERRLTEVYARLMALGHHRAQDLAAHRGEKLEATQRWLDEAEQDNRLFAVEVDGELVVPASLLDPELREIAEWHAVLEVVHQFRGPGWPRWTWIDLPNGWLDGGVPSEIIQSDPQAVLRAAKRKLESLRG